MLLGSLWHEQVLFRGKFYAGEPARALLFQTRETARIWCQEEASKFLDRNDCCAKWRFRPVRVTETVR